MNAPKIFGGCVHEQKQKIWKHNSQARSQGETIKTCKFSDFRISQSTERKILLLSADDMSNSEIVSSIGVCRNTVAAFVAKYIAAGIDYALNDSIRSGKSNSIYDNEKAWITNIACTKPKNIGYAEEL